MSKQIEALKHSNSCYNALRLAEEALIKANHFHDYEDELAAIREALAEPVKQEPEIVAILEGGVVHLLNNAPMSGFWPLSIDNAEPVKQDPVAHYKDAPHTIYLQTGCEDPEFCECSFNEWGDTTWCKDQIHDTDIPYIRADYAAPVDAKAIRAERKWVDLTDDEIAQEFCLDDYDYARAVIAAFKEKNK